MPGSFSDPVDLFFAADIYLQSEEAGLDYFLPVAIATELPVVSNLALLPSPCAGSLLTIIVP